ncbi:unnamed protein product [Penicillium nalgiovense]|nr:unnamed protein product [Penicillium nalgiovense]CAG8095340.1 unnamed protein product [Penicillium nalgiovense]CAG8171365.1 unnamed protein product [Penicillium nalgiovense]
MVKMCRPILDGGQIYGSPGWSRCEDQSWIVTRFMVALDGQDVKTNRGWWPLWMVKM